MSTSNAVIPAISEQSIADWVGSRNYSMGRSYFESGAIVEARRQGNALKAWCQGSMSSPYRLRVTLGPRGIVESDCSCPVGGGGRCKHVGALLIAWLREPDAFPAEEELEANLERRGKSELIALIKQMLRIQPDLESVLDMPLPGITQGAASVDPSSYRRQVAAALQRAGDDWYAQRRIPSEIDISLEAADRFISQFDFNGATIVYQAVAQGIIENYELVQDDDGELCAAVDRCVEGLHICLASGGVDANVREDSLHTLFSVYLFNLDYGGGDSRVSAPDAILEHATAEEKSAVADWLRTAIPQGDSWSSLYRRRTYGRFLLQLESTRLDDESFLRICRECDLVTDLVSRLLALGRTEEAVACAESCGDNDLVALADIFHRHSCLQLIESFLVERAETSRNNRLLDWLKEKYEEHGDLEGGLDFARQMLARNPRLDGYQEVRQIARELGVWQELRPQLLDQLSADEQHYLLTDIHLEEGEIDQALESVRRRNFLRPHGDHQLVRVAQAASATQPQESLEIYRKMVELLIEERGRENYQSACTHLLQMRDIHDRLQLESGWADFITQLREQHRRLPAFLEELANAGL